MISKMLGAWILLLGWLVYANNELILTPAAGMPVTQIMGVAAVDVSGLQPGDLIAYDLFFENIDFDFAACEFQIYFPFGLTSMSGQNMDWSSGSGAVFLLASDLAALGTVALPIDVNGQRVAPAGVVEGSVRVGLVFADPMARWRGSPSSPHPGGRLGTIRFTWHGSPSCASQLEPIQVLVGPSFGTGLYDYFSDALGNRTPIVSTAPLSLYGLEGVSAYFGDPNRRIRADANQDLTRDATDALPAALCALNGQNQCAGGIWASIDPAEYLQTFDFNCDGAVLAIDALGLARLCLGLRDRTQTGDAVSAPVQALSLSTGADSLELDLGAFSGRLVYLSIAHYGVTLESPRLSGPPSGSAWQMIYAPSGDFIEVLIVNPSETPVPKIHFELKGPAEGAEISVTQAIIQALNGTVSKPTPSLVAN